VEYCPLILELHLTLGGMDVDINQMGRDGKEEDAKRKATGWQ